MAQKVSQSTIDQIKKMGMAKALKLAGQNASATQAGVTAEWAEGVRRMYGKNRYDAAVKAATPNKSTPAKSVSAAPQQKTTYNRLTGEKVTYTETPKSAAKPKAKTPAEPPKYNRYTQQKVDYTTKKAAAPKPKAKKPLPPAPKYNRYTQQKVK